MNLDLFLFEHTETGRDDFELVRSRFEPSEFIDTGGVCRCARDDTTGVSHGHFGADDETAELIRNSAFQSTSVLLGKEERGNTQNFEEHRVSLHQEVRKTFGYRFQYSSTLVNVATKKLHTAYTLTPNGSCKLCGLTLAADGFEVFDQL